MRSRKLGSPVNGLTLVVFACVPGRGSEPGAGWEAALAAAKWAAMREIDCTVITRSLGRCEILRLANESRALRSVRWEFIDLPERVERVLGGRASRLAFLAWQLRVLTRVRRSRISRGIVHLSTYATDAIPPVSLLLAPPAGRVWGPLGSTEVAWKRNTKTRLREWWKSLIVKVVARRAGLILAQSPHVVRRAGKNSRARQHIRVQPNVVVDTPATLRPSTRVFAKQLVIVGNLSAGKRPDLAVDALTWLTADFGLVVVGDGELRESLLGQVESAGLEGRVRFVGTLRREAALAVMKTSDVLVHPSEHEGAPWVVGEALTLGTPVVAFRGSGADSLIEAAQSAGVVVESPGAEALAQGIAMAIARGRGKPTDLWSRDAWQAAVFGHYDDVFNGLVR